MSVPKDDRVYLWDMLTAARAAVDFTRGRTLAEARCLVSTESELI